MKKEIIEQLIKYNEAWIAEIKKSMQNPIQKVFGTDHLILQIIELETELKKLKDELINIKK